jgi:diguanylate cyclase (GGDEF)-like protein
MRSLLVVAADPRVRAALCSVLEAVGYDVTEAAGSDAGTEVARRQLLDLVVLDAELAGTDGLAFLQDMRADARTAHLPVLLLLPKRAKDADLVVGLDGGADACLARPFGDDLLLAYVRAVLRRADQNAARNPLTKLPGNERVRFELTDRLQRRDPMMLLYIDIDDFKSYNDYYGFLRGDEAIQAVARVLRTVVSELGDEATFVGHVGGDDFVVLLTRELGEEVASRICTRFDAVAPTLYDVEDRDRGTIEVVDRRGVPQHYPLLSLSIGCVSAGQAGTTHPGEMAERATEMKRYAKKHATHGSSYAMDRRRR